MTGLPHESDVRNGLRGDPATTVLRANVMQWQDIKQNRLAATQRHLDPVAEELGKLENRVAEWVKRALRKHPVWAWLKDYPGLGGCHTAFLIAAIGDPRRFPGQACSVGHILPPLYAVGSPCPRIAVAVHAESEPALGGSEADEPSVSEKESGDSCPGKMLAPRTTTGVRSLWHYCGLHAVNGRSPRKTKGQRASWNPRVRASLLQPDGIADHIVRSRVPHYRDIYDREKERIARERGVVDGSENAPPNGSAKVVAYAASDKRAGLPGVEVGNGSVLTIGSGGAELAHAIDQGHGPLRPFQVDDLARKIAVKDFVGDLLIAWKDLLEREKPRHGAGAREKRGGE